MAKKSIVVNTSSSQHVLTTDEVLLESIIAVHDTYSTPFRTVLVLEGGKELKCAEDPHDIRSLLHEEGLWQEVKLRVPQPV